MKYIKRHPLLLEDKNWLVSMKDDIVDCSHDLTDLPYNFYHCGREEDGEDYSYLDYEDGKYTILYTGNLVVGEGKRFVNFDGVISGLWDDSVGLIPDGYSQLGSGGFKDLVDSLLPAVEDVIIKLRGIVFNDGEWVGGFTIHSDAQTYNNNGEDVNYVDILINIMFKKK